MDVFSFMIMLFLIFFTIQYNLYILSFLAIIVYSIAVPSLLNILLVLFLVVLSFLFKNFSAPLFAFAIGSIIIILLINIFKGNKKPKEDEGFGNLEDLFKN